MPPRPAIARKLCVIVGAQGEGRGEEPTLCKACGPQSGLWLCTSDSGEPLMGFERKEPRRDLGSKRISLAVMLRVISNGAGPETGFRLADYCPNLMIRTGCSRGDEELGFWVYF